MFSQTPIFSDVADWYAYPALTQGRRSEITISDALGSNKGYITLQTDCYFLFTGFAASTNYDNAGGVFASANSTAVIGQPSVPNNFLLEMQRASSNNYSNTQLSQAEVCSSGMLAGKQNPYPIVYGPGVTLSFNFIDTTGLFLLDEDDDPVPLTLQFWMLGYSIPQGPGDSNWQRFLGYFPELARVYSAR